MNQVSFRHLLGVAVMLALCGSAAGAEQRGVTDNEIRIGQTMPSCRARSPTDSVTRARRQEREPLPATIPSKMHAKSPEVGSPRMWCDLQRAYFGTFELTACTNSMNARNLLGVWARFA